MSTNSNSNLFGNFFAQSLQGLFGNQSREQSQNFSNQPALSNLSLQGQAATNAAAESRNLAGLAAREGAAINNELAQANNQRQLELARGLKDMNSKTASFTVQKPDGQTQAQKLRGMELSAQSQLLAETQRNQIDLLTRQRALDSQSSFNDFLRQRELSGQQQASSERIAGMQTQASILGSLFGSVGVGGTSSRYWN